MIVIFFSVTFHNIDIYYFYSQEIKIHGMK